MPLLQTHNRKVVMLTRRKFLAIVPAPLLLAAPSPARENPHPRLPVDTPRAFWDMASGPSRTCMVVFRLDPDGIYRMDDHGWAKISEVTEF